MIHQPNNYAVDVIYQAYIHSDSWYKDLLTYLECNLEFLKEYLKQHLPQIKLIPPQGTYLAWLDYKDLSISEARFKEMLIASGVQLSLGSGFGESYNGYARLNYACPRSTLKKALNRIVKNHRH